MYMYGFDQNIITPKVFKEMTNTMWFSRKPRISKSKKLYNKSNKTKKLKNRG